MKLVSLKLVNVRSHKESFVEFKNGITVIWGKTGSGKSTILMAIYYALFGSADLSNSEIMARNSKKMLIELKFVQNNDEYVIIRGLKKTGESILIDSDNLKVLKNGAQLNILSRANDINSIIRDILGFGLDSKPNLMFQVLSYTKQDNIRNLIEMKKEERQDFIDKILQLSKYKTAYENLKPLTDNYYLKHEKIIQITEFLTAEKSSLEMLENNKKELDEKISDNDKKLSVINPAISSKAAELKKLAEELKILRLNNEKSIIHQQRKKQLDSLIKNVSAEKNTLGSKKNFLEPKITNKLLSVDELNQKLSEEASKLKVTNYRILSLKKENESILGLDSLCPTCRQKITGEHKKELSKKNDDELILLEKDKKRLENEISRLNESVNLSKKDEQLRKELSTLDSAITLLSNQLKNYEAELKDLLKERFDESFEEKILKTEQDHSQVSFKINDLNSKKSGIESASAEITNQLRALEKELLEKNKKLAEYAEKIKDENHVKLSLEFLNRLRSNVKDVRQIIRTKFLNEFKNSFAKKFEEIRNNDDEYYVEINQDYEPIAYSIEGIEVPINHLSGGEKTSAALAYRLALSDLAGEMNNLMPSELLILDEPTTGFDNDDIKALPEALGNLSSIPQIIIVTHEALLKEVANNCVEIRKDNGYSKVTY